jgi:hypothetical protein
MPELYHEILSVGIVNSEDTVHNINYFGTT